MRLTRARIFAAAWLFAVALARPSAAAPQAPETLSPAESEAKAKALLQQTTAALGGPAYLGLRDEDCTLRLSLFGHSGDLTGYETVRDLWKLPDKERTEYSKKANIIDVYNGNQGWTLDKGGVTEQTAAAMDEFQESLKTDIDNLLRNRLNEPGMIFRYAGSDVVDLNQVDWVEIVDRDRRTFRLAIDRASHLYIRTVIITRNPTTRERTEESVYYSNYHPIQSVQTPFQITRERNGQKVYQAFLTECRYNSGLSEDLFTRASLDKRWGEIAKKQKKK